MADQAERTPEDLMVEEGIWPRTGGWWQCADHGFFSSYDLVEWRHESGAPGWQCPECGRRDLIQWEQALIAAHHDHAIEETRKQVITEVEEALTSLDAHRAVAKAAMREIKSNPTFRHEEEWAIFQSVVADRLATLKGGTDV